MSAASSGMSGGQPSTTQPSAGPWLSPKVVTRKRWPKVLWDMPRIRRKPLSCHLPAFRGASLEALTNSRKLYIHMSIYMEFPVTVAKVFKSGNSQAVRLPKEFRVATDEVEIFRRGDEIVLRERPRNLLRALDILASLPDDFLEDRRDTLPQERKGL